MPALDSLHKSRVVLLLVFLLASLFGGLGSCRRHKVFLFAEDLGDLCKTSNALALHETDAKRTALLLLLLQLCYPCPLLVIDAH